MASRSKSGSSEPARGGKQPYPRSGSQETSAFSQSEYPTPDTPDYVICELDYGSPVAVLPGADAFEGPEFVADVHGALNQVLEQFSITRVAPLFETGLKKRDFAVRVELASQAYSPRTPAAQALLRPRHGASPRHRANSNWRDSYRSCRKTRGRAKSSSNSCFEIPEFTRHTSPRVPYRPPARHVLPKPGRRPPVGKPR